MLNAVWVKRTDKIKTLKDRDNNNGLSERLNDVSEIRSKYFMRKQDQYTYLLYLTISTTV